MSTYPGENPQPPEGQQPDGTSDDAGTEPTQPVGYWERQAAEQAREQSQQGHPYASPSGAVFNPTSSQPSQGSQGPQEDGTRAYEQAPYGQPGYGQPYGQPTYGQPTYGQPTYGQPGYGYPPPGGQSGPPPGQPGYSPYSFTPPRPDHPQSSTAMILGIVGLVGGFVLCGLGLIVSPFAWALGRNALKEIEASQGRIGGEGQARAGMITGIIGTVLLVLAVIGILAFAVLVIAGTSTSSGTGV